MPMTGEDFESEWKKIRESVKEIILKDLNLVFGDDYSLSSDCVAIYRNEDCVAILKYDGIDEIRPNRGAPE
jgi:hypothetical protein